MLEVGKLSAKEMEYQMVNLQEELKGLYDKIGENQKIEEALSRTTAELALLQEKLDHSGSQDVAELDNLRKRLAELEKKLKVAAYDKTQMKMAFFDPSRPQDFLFISCTKMRTLAKNREDPPDGFMRPGGWKVLEYYDSVAASEGKKRRELMPA